jgi:nicotinamidase-related amidase
MAGLADDYFSRLETQVVPNIQQLLGAFRRAMSPVLFAKIEMQRRDLADAVTHYRLRHFTSVVGSREAEILNQIAPHPNELVIAKTSTSAFNSTAIDHALRNLQVRTLVVAGVNTDACVELTSRDAVDRGYWVVVVHDACAAISGEAHHIGALDRLRRAMVTVETTSEVVARMDSSHASHATRA